MKSLHSLTSILEANKILVVLSTENGIIVNTPCIDMHGNYHRVAEAIESSEEAVFNFISSRVKVGRISW